MKAGVVVKQLDAAEKAIDAMDVWLQGRGSVEAVRQAVRAYWATKPVPPALADSVEWKA